jgi:hypothetical protein
VSRKLWEQKLADAALLLGEDVSADALVSRFGRLTEKQIDTLADAASSRVVELGDSRLAMAHFEDAAEQLDEIGVDEDGGDPAVEADGGPASPERVDALEDRVDGIEASVAELQDDLEDLYVQVDVLINDLRSAGSATGGEQWGDEHV